MGFGADPPLPAPLTPPEKQCPECKGAGTVVAWLGETKPCPKCGGSGSVIEVVEEKLTAWQQRMEKMLRQILAYVEPGVAMDEAEDKALGLARSHPPDDVKPLDYCEPRKS